MLRSAAIVGLLLLGRSAHAQDREGRFAARDVIEVISARRQAIQFCYQDQLRSQPMLAGQLVIAMTVESTGETVNVRVADDELTPPSPSVNACLIRVIDELRFEPAPLGGSVSFTVPFVFGANGARDRAVGREVRDRGVAD